MIMKRLNKVNNEQIQCICTHLDSFKINYITENVENNNNMEGKELEK